MADLRYVFQRGTMIVAIACAVIATLLMLQNMHDSLDTLYEICRAYDLHCPIIDMRLPSNP
jgi:hypothetical protein